MESSCASSIHELSVKNLLAKITTSWSQRAQVRKPIVDLAFDLQADDFLEDLLPFKDHPHYLAASWELKKQVLSCGWFIYNYKTVAVETEVINPCCVSLLADEIPGVSDFISKQVISETMVDESYHVLLVVKAVGVTSQQRNFTPMMSMTNLVKKMRSCQTLYNEQWQKKLVQLATAIVSEIFISDYLKLLSDCKTIQPLHQLTVAAHRKDEAVHANIFTQLTKAIYSQLDQQQRSFLAQILPKPVRWFADRDLALWLSLLEQINFPHAKEIIADCQSINDRCLELIDYQDLLNLSNEIGLMDVAVGREAFYEEGLLSV